MQRLDYYPPHFYQTRPYIKPLLRAFDEQGGADMAYEQVFSQTAKYVSRAAMDMGLKLEAIDSQAFSLECRSAMLYNAWRLEGSVIYDFSPALLEALKHSSLAEVCIDDLQYPFDTLYMSFGPQSEFVLESGAQVTGAYVYYAPGKALRISLTAPLPAGTPLFGRGYEIYDLGIKAKHFPVNLEEAVKLALEDDLEDIRRGLATMRGEKDEPGRPGAIATLERLLETQAAQFNVYRQVVNLVANGLCYASAYQDDIREIWPATTPEKLKDKAQGQGKEAQRAVSKLLSMGYRKVRYIGADFSEAVDDSPGVAPHMRKAHWRNQAYGPGHQLRKLVWIHKTRVLGGTVSEEPRIYRDSPKDGHAKA